MNPAVHLLSLCSILASALFLWLGGYILKSNPRARVNQLFTLICFCFLIWSFSYTFFRGAAEKETAWFWFKLSSVGWTISPALVLHFLLLVSRNRNRLEKPAILTAIYLPSLYFLFHGLSGTLSVVDIVWTDFGWSDVYGPLTPTFVSYLLYFSISVSLGLGSVASRGLTSELIAERRQARLVFFTGVPILTAIAMSGIVLPYLGIRSVPNIAHLFTAFWVLVIWYAISTYKLMILTPATVASEVLRTMADAVILLGRRQEIVGVNRAAEELLSARDSDLRGSRLHDLFEAEDTVESETIERLLSKNGDHDLALSFRKKCGDLIRLRVSTSSVSDRYGQVMGRVLIARDVTDQLRAEQELKHLATHDPLTGLPNRSILHDRLQRAVNRAARDRRPFALLMFDLDGFKQINDTFGQGVGDQVLQSAATRLSRCVRGLDTVCRLGADEFMLVVEELIESGDSDIVAKRLLDAFGEPIDTGDHTISISASIGISTYPFDGLDPETLIKKADLALHSSKKIKGGFEFYAPRMDALNRERTKIEQGLRQALARDELFLAYQPLVDFETGRVAGVEALLRWQSSEIGLVGPDKFIPVAERSGLIVPIGQWVLELACRTSKEWQDSGLPAVPMGVNISAKQLQQDDFLAIVETVLRDTGLRPELLELELTESAAMEDHHRSLDLLARLRDLGVRIVIDDFGTGYSSLSRLKLLPMHAVKVDRSFIENIAEDPRDRALVMAMVAMARNLGVDVIAEGVESVDQLQVLRSFENQSVTLFRCDKLQGYLFSRPVEKDKIPELFYRTHEIMNDADGEILLAADGTIG